MNVDEYLHVMKITETEFDTMDIFTLKKKYKILALSYHPDKGGTVEDFQKLSESYGTLTRIKLTKLDDSKINDNNIQKYLDLFMYLLHNKELRSYLYGKCVFIINDLINNMREKIIKTRNDLSKNIIELNPSFNDIFINNLYKYNYENTFFLIPLWHSEVHFEYNNKNIIFICNPNIPSNCYIDENNMLHVILEYNIGEIIHQDNIIVILNNTEYKIPVGNLLIRKYQIYTLNNIGLTSINTSDIYDTKERMDIIFHINLLF